MRLGKNIGVALAGIALLAWGTTSNAQDYPKKGLVTIIVPYAAGGTTDQQGRMAADILSKALDGTFIAYGTEISRALTTTSRNTDRRHPLIDGQVYTKM